MIAIVCYGLGNVQAIANIYKRLNVPVTLASVPEDLQNADKLILPGVGAFDWAMTRLNDSGMRETLDRLVLDEHRPILGICVGMQMLANRSEEGSLPGLGWIQGEIMRLDVSKACTAARLPHMGWNNVEIRNSEGLFHNFDAMARFYFLHSYFFAVSRSEDVLTTTDYCGVFASAVGRGNIYGVQFHPEKSHQWGIDLLHNFARLP